MAMKKNNKSFVKQAAFIQKTSLEILKKFPSDAILKKSSSAKLYQSLKASYNLLKQASKASKLSADDFRVLVAGNQDVVNELHQNLKKESKYKSCTFICYQDWKECRKTCNPNDIWDPCWGECNWTKFLCDLNCFFGIKEVTIIKTKSLKK